MSRKKSNAVRQPDPQKTPKIWEKARREKMKVYFNELQEVLPFYDPSTPMSRFEILQKSRAYIKDLQDQNQDLLNGGFDEVYKDKMEKLKQRVKELLQRVDQLTDLLRTANIMIPPLAPCLDNTGKLNSQKWINQRPKKWTEKINLVVPDEKIDNVLYLIKNLKKKSPKGSKKLIKSDEKRKKSDKELDTNSNKISEENKKIDEKAESVSEKTDKFTDSQSPSHTKENQPIDFNLINNEEASKKTEKAKEATSEKVQSSEKCDNTVKPKTSEKTSTNLVKPQNVFIPAQPNTFLLTNDGNLVQVPILNSNPNVLTQTVNQLTPLVINRPPPVIVLQKPAPQVIVNPTPQILSVPKPSVQILGNSVIYASNPSSISKTLPYILSKPPANKRRITRDSTVTTYVNKIPIPALSKQSYAKKMPISSKGSKKSKESEKEKEKEVGSKKDEEKKADEEKTKESEKKDEDESGKEKDSLKNEVEPPAKKQKVNEKDENVFKPIDNPESTDVFCNLELPNAINPVLPVSPTAAFLSTFPIVAQSKADENEDVVSKSPAEKNEQEKEKAKEAEKEIPNDKIPICNIEKRVEVEKTITVTSSITATTTTNTISNNTNVASKTWQTSEMQTETYFPPQPVNNTNPVPNFSENTYKPPSNFTMNEPQVVLKPQFDYAQKNVNFKKPCTDNYNKNNYQDPNYQLIPAKEVVRNTRPPVNWMTDPDIRSRSMNYNDKMASKPYTQPDTNKPYTQPDSSKPYTQPDSFYMNNQNAKVQSEFSAEFQNEGNNNTNNKMNYQYVKEQRCKNVEKRTEQKCGGNANTIPNANANANIFKPPQNSYNIFDYNYNTNCFPEEDPNKYCNVQTFPKNTKKSIPKKKIENMNVINEPQNDLAKRATDQIIPIDFNPVPNQECFSWVPGKNMDWLPGKFDTNLVVPSTLPTLVGDLALGTTTTNDTHTKPQKPCQKNQEPKNYIELGLSNNFTKPMEPDNGKQFLVEPFVNLSKNIFDLPNNVQNPQVNKPGYNTNNETIELKNIFELPAKNFDFNRKQRNIPNTQNTFLSVSQLVETPNFDNAISKNESHLDATTAPKPDFNPQNYPNYNNSKSYKNKNRTTHYKYDRKYHGYKQSSNYTAEALIRSNNVNFQNNEFPENQNFFQKPNQNNNKTDYDINPVGPSQNIYTDFNFSSPVSNFNIGTSMNTDFNHDGNFSSQNNTFFGDFIPPEYPLTESVSNSLLLPPCSVGLQNPFIIEKRTPEKKSHHTKNFSNSRNRKHYECSKSNYNDFSIANSTLACPPIFTSSTCQNLLPNATEAITFSGSTFTSNNITFPPLSTNSNTNFHRFSTPAHSTSSSFLSTSCSTTIVSSQNCFLTNPTTSVTNSVITTPFSGTQTSTLPFLSLSNPIIPPSVPSTSGNTLANFNLSTIFPEINQKGNYHYP